MPSQKIRLPASAANPAPNCYNVWLTASLPREIHEVSKQEYESIPEHTAIVYARYCATENFRQMLFYVGIGKDRTRILEAFRADDPYTWRNDLLVQGRPILTKVYVIEDFCVQDEQGDSYRQMVENWVRHIYMTDLKLNPRYGPNAQVGEYPEIAGVKAIMDRLRPLLQPCHGDANRRVKMGPA
jgi:hypothetical protein